MPVSAPQFEIRSRAHHDGAITTLHRGGDANTATGAFQAALERLRAESRQGEGLLVTYDPVRRILLRQALATPSHHRPRNTEGEQPRPIPVRNVKI